MSLPIIDLSSPSSPSAIKSACEDVGFFYVVGHGVDPALEKRLEEVAKKFFELPLEIKNEIGMEKGGAAWRGYFPVGGELTSGAPDRKEGIYFGSELPNDDPRVISKIPLHGPNLWPQTQRAAHSLGSWPEFRETVTAWIESSTELGHKIARALALSLNIPENYFYDRYTKDPIILFRIFHYPPSEPDSSDWGVGEHSDYGLLTILKQDEVGGLQVKSRNGWIDAPPIPGSFIVNIGDMLDRLTGGRYRSTPHRVRNVSGKSRYSYPLFFDPAWNAELEPLPNMHAAKDDRTERWDRQSVHEFSGKYGDYLLGKVSRVFPDLARKL